MGETRKPKQLIEEFNWYNESDMRYGDTGVAQRIGQWLEANPGYYVEMIKTMALPTDTNKNNYIGRVLVVFSLMEIIEIKL
jgi:hypothetical protein